MATSNIQPNQPPLKKRRPILKIDINSDDGITDTESNTSSPIISIPEHLQKLKSDMNYYNYTYLSDGDFGDKFLDKIKKQFVQKSDKAFSLGVRLFYFKNKNEKTFTKVFAYSKDSELEPDNVLIKILSEVYYHKKFSELQSSCNFRVPELLKYGFIEYNNDENINIGDEFIFYIRKQNISDKI